MEPNMIATASRFQVTSQPALTGRMSMCWNASAVAPIYLLAYELAVAQVRAAELKAAAEHYVRSVAASN